jgi:peptidyl-prolyl cis-trans isomerase SurA
MRKLVLTLLTSGLFISAGWGQTLFTYGENKVSRQEFLRNYNKNAQNKKPDLSEPALKEYLDLYSLFRMKVREAELMKMDTLQSIQRELDNYRKQLAKNYLTDEEVTNKLFREAYDRMKEERHVAHILIMAPPNMSPEDTLKAYKKMDSIYTAITKKKADFGTLAAAYSEDKGTKDKGGDIGFMTSLQTIYPFENAVYTTEAGKISAPFRTQFGYHIVRVIEKRPARGEVQIAQILVSTPKSRGTEGEQAAKKRVDSIYAQLKSGASFEELVKKYSDDKYTVNEGGVMPQIGVGKTIPEIENAAFALKNKGDISQPVRTDYGYHIFRLIDKMPLKPYDSMRSQIKRMVENDSRSQTARDKYFEKIKQQNGFKENIANLEEVAEKLNMIPDTGKDANSFKADDYANMNKVIFSLGKNNYTQKDFLTFAETLTRGRLMGPKKSVVKDIYNMYVSRIVNDYQEHKLVEENEDFRNLMQEYRDGIMLFELMDQNVWGKASRDTTGLKQFYESNKGKYQWEAGFSGTVYHFKNEAAMNKGMKVLSAKAEAKDEDVTEAVNSESEPDAITLQQGRFEFSRFTDVPKDKLVKGKLSAPVKNQDGTYTVVKVNEIYNSSTAKTLDEARGYVVAEYQDFLEKKWNEQLRQKYPMNVDQGVFRAMVK